MTHCSMLGGRVFNPAREPPQSLQSCTGAPPGGPQQGGREQRGSAQEEARARSLWHPLLSTALTWAGPGAFNLRQARPRSSREAPGQHPRVPGPPGVLATQLSSVARIAGSGSSRSLFIYFRSRALRKAQQRSDPSSGRAPPDLARLPPMVPQSFFLVLRGGTPPQAAPTRRRAPPPPEAALAVCPFSRLRAFADTLEPSLSPLAFTTSRGAAAGQSRSTGAVASSVVRVSPVSAVAVRHLGPQRLYAV
ncbi:hypothetical protein NDU88_006659 [Pleurodeles waltl]|uniref:Uncharacterized protein n=1 Tax=Pleurodeles waltl TaxID=8319 RepID=A0AAV7N1N1_PLEWA|nr:hypothetical protein NDU88_006659 [Pleurodeles waltl]